ncbi:hypothetical protein [Paraglaciecola sp.]|uniref:hypothetical protein n=1 Tax=Paraglaciecola sp. TaxID=1920173 RepID=UPI0032674263
MFKEILPQLYKEAKNSLLKDGEIEFASQLDSCLIKSCESLASDDSAFTVNFEGFVSDIIEDTFPSGSKKHTVMVCYSNTHKVIGIDVFGCENTKLQQELQAACI